MRQPSPVAGSIGAAALVIGVLAVFAFSRIPWPATAASTLGSTA